MLDVLIQQFLDHLAVRRSANTVRSYGSDLAQLSAFLVGVDLVDVDFKNGSIIVMGKGSKERVTFFGKTATSAIRDYVSAERVDALDGKALFTNSKGGRLTTRTVQYVVKRWSIRVGLSP